MRFDHFACGPRKIVGMTFRGIEIRSGGSRRRRFMQGIWPEIKKGKSLVTGNRLKADHSWSKCGGGTRVEIWRRAEKG